MQTMRGQVVLVVSVFFMLMIAGCGNIGSGGPKTVTSISGQSQVVVPKGWTARRTLHDTADLQVANLVENAYLVVLSDSKMDLYDMTLEAHSELTRKGLLKGVKDSRVTSGPLELKINGRRAVQYELRGSVEGTRIVYLHTTVDGEHSFHQIIAWTLPSKLQKNRSVLKSVIESFREVES